MVSTEGPSFISVRALQGAYIVTITREGTPAISQEFSTLNEALEFAMRGGDLLGVPLSDTYLSLDAMMLNSQQAAAAVEVEMRGGRLDA
ncbi:Hypothetical protein DEACI_3128 [Acididesulfobacillus acetoxydans]|uniref:Uncharacterized protein n=1 Tax=Acididesulfobacillus acetoxydans TaxID=1561005 RepID=A0A8S0WQ81_9FIRM|nr:hypothetical protein [Acididesulfobacillus acetoxydans]CAA7602454.1 Hypothetical protein DEACI_3128 [Acididesulfobacillus acetoxydans]CEJ05909.1 Hypothetical protein DEACI_0329 [Acididesulfobacillus acetoxydans]